MPTSECHAAMAQVASRLLPWILPWSLCKWLSSITFQLWLLDGHISSKSRSKQDCKYQVHWCSEFTWQDFGSEVAPCGEAHLPSCVKPPLLDSPWQLFVCVCYALWQWVNLYHFQWEASCLEIPHIFQTSLGQVPWNTQCLWHPPPFLTLWQIFGLAVADMIQGSKCH